MAEELKVKGMTFGPIVAALKASPRLQGLVPARLQHYFEETLLSSSWYPAEDYLELVDVLARTVDPKLARGDPYRFLGVIGAQRDIKGSEEQIPEKQRFGAGLGIYGRALYSPNLASYLRRLFGVHQLYYSAGAYVARRTGERTLAVRMVGSPVTSASFCSMLTGYMGEAVREEPFRATVEEVSCRATGDAECEWEMKFAAEVDVSALAAFE